MNDFLQNLKKRKMAQWAFAYLAGAWVVLQVLDLAVESYDWPGYVMQFSFSLAVLGFLVTVLLAWYHGERGVQKVSGVELLILAVLLVIGGGLLSRTLPDGEAALETVAPENNAPAISDGKSVAVLPFIDLTQTGDHAWFVDGLTEEILNNKENGRRIAWMSTGKMLKRFAAAKLLGKERDMFSRYGL
jgi:hypothetical protein